MTWLSGGAGFNFRQTSGFVADSTGQTYVIASDSYPQTRSLDGESVTFGVEADPGGTVQKRDRTTGTGAPRLAGGHALEHPGGSAGDEMIFRVDLPATGPYRITLACGDPGYDNTEAFFEIRDTASAKITQAEATMVGRFRDASLTDRASAAAWISDNVTSDQTFATTIFRFVLKRPVSGTSWISHINLLQLGSGASPVLGRRIYVLP